MEKGTPDNSSKSSSPSDEDEETPSGLSVHRKLHFGRGKVLDDANHKENEDNNEQGEQNSRPETKGKIIESGINWGIPSNAGAQNHVIDNHGKDSLRYRALEILHSTTVQVILMLVLLLDVIVIFIEIFLLASFPPCRLIRRDGINCCPAEVLPDGVRFLAGDDSAICKEEGFEPIFDTEAGCDSHQWHVAHTVEEVLFFTTIFLLTTFWTELHIEMWALGLKTFFRQFFFALDYLIVTVSLALEILFHVLSQTSFQAAVGLLLVVRVWRFVRIGHGLIEISHEYAHHEYNKLLSYTEELEEILTNECNRSLSFDKSKARKEGKNRCDILSDIEKKRRKEYRERKFAKKRAAENENNESSSAASK